MGPVLHIRTEVHIKASAEETWRQLINTSTWPKWNSFIPEAINIGASNDSHGSSTVLGLGSCYRFIANMRGRKWKSVQKVIIFEPPSDERNSVKLYRAHWAVQGYPGWLFKTVRSNEIEEVITEEGAKECIYRTGEDQWGPLAYLIKILFGTSIEKGIKDWASDLKQAMEH